MPILSVYVTEDDLATLQRFASEEQRSVEDLAEAALENAVMLTRRVHQLGDRIASERQAAKAEREAVEKGELPE